jgi:hypothetical protein
VRPGLALAMTDRRKNLAPAMTRKYQMLLRAKELGIDFVLIKADRFTSGFAKENLGNLLIDFPDLPKPRELEKVISLLHGGLTDRENFFYLYYRRNDNRVLSLRQFTESIKRAIPDSGL